MAVTIVLLRLLLLLSFANICLLLLLLLLLLGLLVSLLLLLSIVCWYTLLGLLCGPLGCCFAAPPGSEFFHPFCVGPPALPAHSPGCCYLCSCCCVRDGGPAGEVEILTIRP